MLKFVLMPKELIKLHHNPLSLSFTILNLARFFQFVKIVPPIYVKYLSTFRLVGKSLAFLDNIQAFFDPSKHFIEFSSHPEQPQGLPLCSIQSRAAKEKFRNQIQTAQYGTEVEAVKRIMWNLPPPAQGIRIGFRFEGW